ncbi:MAG: ATP-dependent Clp protease adaptor ClpS [Lentisphaerae bacterium GWF2_52_8]|nr:MAG: ATP-dependent Clp protease adaptor ClpS [Lentisphaerae bacterium GWF2_52_8]
MAQHREEFLTDGETELREPPLYKVIILNDDYTPMDFVVMVLISVFNKQQQEAERIMLSVHQQGQGLCGIYPYEVAETKLKTVEYLAEKERHPLRCVMEEE